MIWDVGWATWRLSSWLVGPARQLPVAGDVAPRCLRSAFAAALNAQDAARAASYYTEDAVLIPPGEPLVRGRAAIEAYWTAAIQAGGVRDVSVETLDARSSGDLGYEIGSFALTATGPNGEALTERGRYIELLERGTDGRWYSTAGIWNAAPE